MSTRNNKLALAIAVALGLALPASAFATNGYFSHGYGTKNKGIAGAGVALPQDAMQAATNPAGMVLVGERLDLGLAWFSPMRQYTASGAGGPAFPAFNLINGTVESENESFLIPHLAYNHMLDPNNSVGVTVYGNGGMNTEYPAEATGGMGTFFTGAVGAGGAAGVDLSQLFVSTTYAHKFAANTSVGASVIFAHQRFRATGLQAFGAFGLSNDSNALTNNSHDSSSGWGAKLGGQVGLGSVVTLGASYQSKIFMSKFRKYAGLFADEGDFDIPATATVGAAFKLTPNHAIALDVQRIWYSEVESIGNPLMPSFGACSAGANPNAETCLGGNDGPGFGWEDITIYKLGYQWTLGPAWTIRAGYSNGDQPIPSSEVLFNILAPGVQEEHYTVGFTWNTSPTSEINFAGMYSPRSTVTGLNPLAAGSQTIELSMKQYELEVSFGLKF